MPKDSATNTFISDFSDGNRWLGLTDISNEGQWVFEDGQALQSSSYSYWNPGQPNNYDQDCAAFVTPPESLWKDIRCGSKRGFICRIDQVSQNLRDDYRCGQGYTTVDGRTAECDPDSSAPCCSSINWCGNTEEHCNCVGCVDYRNTVDHSLTLRTTATYAYSGSADSLTVEIFSNVCNDVCTTTAVSGLTENGLVCTTFILGNTIVFPVPLTVAICQLNPMRVANR
ncbi:uncharacterized protein LOC144927080 [Branchiostoma floridae x Branchiostoma belcheri]